MRLQDILQSIGIFVVCSDCLGNEPFLLGTFSSFQLQTMGPTKFLVGLVRLAVLFKITPTLQTAQQKPKVTLGYLSKLFFGLELLFYFF